MSGACIVISLGTQCNHGVDANGASSWDHGGNQGNGEKDDRYAEESGGVERTYAEEYSLQHPCHEQTNGETDTGTDRDRPHRLPAYLRDDIPPTCPKCDAYSNLAGAPSHREGDRPVNTN